MTTKEFKKEIESMKSGEVVFINAINLSVKQINILIEYVKSGVLVPDIESVKAMCKDVDGAMQGRFLLPQMEYIKA